MNRMYLYFITLMYCSLLGQEIPYGQEFSVNTNTANLYAYPMIASLINGSFVICWQNHNYKSDTWDVYGQVFSNNGNKIGTEFHINKYAITDHPSPQIVSLFTGGFVVSWQSNGQDGSAWGIFGQVFSLDGTKVNSEFRVNTYMENNQQYPQMAPLPNGGFVICWQSDAQDGSAWGVYGQVFSSDGTKVNSEFRVNTYTKDDQQSPQIVSLPNGGFVIGWESFVYPAVNASEWEVYCQLFKSDGTQIGTEIHVNTDYYGRQYRPRIASLPNGGFFICWESDRIYGQVFSSDGTKVGGQLQVNTYIKNMSTNPQIASLENGNTVISYESDIHDGSKWGIFSQMFLSNGTKLNEEFQVNTYTQENQEYPKIASLPNGGFVISWKSTEYDYTDFFHSKVGIYTQLYTSDGTKVGNEFHAFTNLNLNDYFHNITTLPSGVYVVCCSSVSGIYAKCLPESPQLHILKSFNLLEPSNDSSIKIYKPTLVWRQPSKLIVCYPWELHYKILVDDNPDFSSPQITEQDQDTSLTLQNLTPGTTYFWKVLAKNIAGDSLWSSNTNAFFVSHDATDNVIENTSTQPNQFALHQNYPNPFNPETTICFDLPESGYIDLSIYDISGKLVKVLLLEFRNAGSHSVKWDGKDTTGNAMPSGIYICRMEAKTVAGKMFVKSVKMGLVR